MSREIVFTSDEELRAYMYKPVRLDCTQKEYVDADGTVYQYKRFIDCNDLFIEGVATYNRVPSEFLVMVNSNKLGLKSWVLPRLLSLRSPCECNLWNGCTCGEFERDMKAKGFEYNEATRSWNPVDA